jgi:hypothetical protein
MTTFESLFFGIIAILLLFSVGYLIEKQKRIQDDFWKLSTKLSKVNSYINPLLGQFVLVSVIDDTAIDNYLIVKKKAKIIHIYEDFAKNIKRYTIQYSDGNVDTVGSYDIEFYRKELEGFTIKRPK